MEQPPDALTPLGAGGDVRDLQPRIAGGPVTLAASGVAVLRVENILPDDVLEVRLGGQPIDLADGARLQWVDPAPSARGSERALAVRAPATLAAGATTLEVSTGSGVLPWPLEVIQPSGVYPDSPLGILWPSAAAAGVFPISTVAAGLLIVDADTGPVAQSGFQYRVQMRSAGRDDCDVALAGSGELYGAESVVSRQGDVEVSHPISGQYELHPQANYIRMSIDRTPSGGVVEAYFGGWVSYPGNTDVFAPELPAPAQRAHPPALDAETAMVLVTSERTGRQLLMSRRVTDEEESSRIRGCLFELP